MRVKVLLLMCLVATTTQASKSEGKKGGRIEPTTTIECDVAIVGGGIGGLYTAEALLREGKETNVCVFERETVLGGRLKDYAFPQVPDEFVGLGGWRGDEANYNLKRVVARLQIPTEEWNFYHNSRKETRGQSSRDEQEIKEQSFPTLMNSQFSDMGTSEMYDLLLQDEALSQIRKFATFETYQQKYLTPEGSQYWFDLYGYEGDKDGSPEGTLEFYEGLSGLTGVEWRPLTGMSAIPQALAKSAEYLGGKIYKGAGYNVLSINKEGGNYVLTTANALVTATKLVIAAPPGSFAKVSGSLAKRIQLQDEFKSVMPRTAFKAAAVYSRAWWEDITDENQKLYPMERFMSNQDCLGSTVPHIRRGENSEAVLHVAYKDGNCGDRWGRILTLTPKSMMDQEITRALEYKFNMSVPEPLDTVYQYWDEGAWYLQKPGSGVSMKQVSYWAKRPFPREEIYVVGSAYNLMRAYSEGALQSANNALYEGWGIPIPSPPKEELEARKYRPRVSLSLVR